MIGFVRSEALYQRTCNVCDFNSLITTGSVVGPPCICLSFCWYLKLRCACLSVPHAVNFSSITKSSLLGSSVHGCQLLTFRKGLISQKNFWSLFFIHLITAQPQMNSEECFTLFHCACLSPGVDNTRKRYYV